MFHHDLNQIYNGVFLFVCFFSGTTKIYFEIQWLCSPPTRAPLVNMPRGKPVCLSISGQYNQYIYTDDSYTVFLGFHSQDNYSPRDKKVYGSFLSMNDPTVIAKGELTWQVRPKVDCSKSHDHFDYWVMDCSATRIPISSIMGHHLQPTSSLIEGGRVTSF